MHHTPSLFLSRFKIYIFHKSFPPYNFPLSSGLPSRTLLEPVLQLNGFCYAALLPRRGPHIASHSVCPSVRPSVPLSLPSVTSFRQPLASRMYYSARTEGRISYGHLVLVAFFDFWPRAVQTKLNTVSCQHSSPRYNISSCRIKNEVVSVGCY